MLESIIVKSRDIDIQIVIERPLARVFEAWIKPEMLERWLARKAVVDPRVGGAYELFWDPEDPEADDTAGCRIIGLVPDAELSFSWKGPKEFAAVMGDKTSIFVRLEPREESTLLRFVHRGWGSGSDWDKARRSQAEAWKEALENLKNMLENTDKYMANISMN